MPGTQLRLSPTAGHRSVFLERERTHTPGQHAARTNATSAMHTYMIHASPPYSPPRLAIRGTHPGCVERRSPEALEWIGVPPGACEFDGRLSLARFRGRYWLYSRANLAPSGGQRFVQVASSADAADWSAFELIRLRGFTPALGDVYFFAVQENPAVPTSLLAVFPMVHRAKACISISFSTDARNWTVPQPLLTCAAAGDRSVHQPAAPAMVRRRGKVYLYIHENVPSIRIDGRTPERLRTRLHQQLQLHVVRPRIVRYSFPLARLRRWTYEALRRQAKETEL
jgi:hypothetical protein